MTSVRIISWKDVEGCEGGRRGRKIGQKRNRGKKKNTRMDKRYM